MHVLSPERLRTASRSLLFASWNRRGAAPLFVLGLLLLGLAGGMAACAPAMETMVAPGESTILVSHVAVYPFKVRFRAEPAVTYQKTVDLVAAAMEPRRFSVYSFGDFQLFSLDTVDLYEGSSLLSVIRQDNLDVAHLAVLKGEAVQVLEVADDRPEAGAGGGHRSGDKIKVKAWVELTHYGEREPVARAESTFVLDPLQATSVDPYPALTSRVRTLAGEVLRLTLKRARVPSPHPALPISYYADQSNLFRISSDDFPSLSRRMATMEEVERSAELLRGYQYFYPDISLLRVQRLSQNPGVLVTEIQAPWLSNQGLKVDDLITHVNGQRVETAHQLDRQVARAIPGDMQVYTVLRSGREVQLELTYPEDKGAPEAPTR